MSEQHYFDFPLKALHMRGMSHRVEGTTLILFNKDGPQWEIRQIDEDHLSLYHRTNDPDSIVMRYTKYTKPATYGGVNSLISHIRRHEKFEKQNEKIGFQRVTRRGKKSGVRKYFQKNSMKNT